MKPLRVTLLAGGVGGAKMAEGLAALEHVELSIIGNIADDDSFHGLWVSPDIDTLTYTLAGVIDRAQGWGVADEGHRALEVLRSLGNDTWMSLGDRDFGLHIYRTQRRLQGDSPSDIAADIARAFGVKPRIILPTDDVVQTRVKTANGWISFQEYFVRERCVPEVLELSFDGVMAARPTETAITAIRDADLLVIAPSNPLVSIAPILEIPHIRQAVINAKAPVIAVSPFIAGKVVKGPADRMFAALGLRVDVVGVAEQYRDLVDMLLIDDQDSDYADEIRAVGPGVATSDILMSDLPAKQRLAGDVISLGQSLMEKRGAA